MKMHWMKKTAFTLAAFLAGVLIVCAAYFGGMAINELGTLGRLAVIAVVAGLFSAFLTWKAL